jgi:hypothetical protein
MEQRKGKSTRTASKNTSKIIVDDMVSKLKVLEIGERLGENMKETISRLIDEEYERLNKNVRK